MSTMNLIVRRAALALLVSAVPLSAQQESAEQDGRWLPFVGCWEAVGAEDEIGLLCFSPAEGGVELINYVEGEVASSELLVADGARRPVVAEGCEGWESVVFSEDGRRAFTNTEFQCENDEIRVGTGVMAILSTTRWADVRALEMEGESVAWVQEYELAGSDVLAEYDIENPAAGLGMPVRTARMAASASIDLNDIIEASSVMDDKAVETWVVLQGDDLNADAGDLMVLADAGVSETVIDAVVAVSNPETFMVEVGEEIVEYDTPPYPVHYRGYMSMAHYWGPRWGLSYRYGYAPYDPWFGPTWAYGGYRYGYWGYRPGYIVVRPRGARGAVVPGRGYRQGSGTAGRTARPRGDSPSAGQSGATSRRSPAAQPRRAKRRTSGGETSSITPVRTPSTGAVSRRAAPAASSRPSNRSARPATRSRTITTAPARSRPSSPRGVSAPSRSGSPRAAPTRSSGTSRATPARPSGASRMSTPRASRPSRVSSPRSSGATRTSRPSTPRASAPRSAPTQRPAASRPSGSRAPAASRPAASSRSSGARPARSSRPTGRRPGGN